MAIVKACPADDEAPSDVEARLRAALLEAIATRDVVSVAWTGNRGTGTSGYRAYGRDHDVRAPGLPPIAGSSDRAFHGDRDRWNPELELTAALSQCHLLSYLHVCADAGVVVTAYSDDARGTMAETGDGGGHFVEVVLRPRVTVSAESMIDAAMRAARGGQRPVLHRQLSQLPGPARACRRRRGQRHRPLRRPSPRPPE